MNYTDISIQFPIGTQVRLSRKFLRNIGDYTKESADLTGVIDGEPSVYGPKFATIPVKWNSDRFGLNMNVNNLVRVDRLHLEHD